MRALPGAFHAVGEAQQHAVGGRSWRRVMFIGGALLSFCLSFVLIAHAFSSPEAQVDGGGAVVSSRLEQLGTGVIKLHRLLVSIAGGGGGGSHKGRGKGGGGSHQHNNNHNSHNDHSLGNIFVLPSSNTTVEILAPWNVPMPQRSLFANFEPPRDELRWNQAAAQAMRGEQVLLKKLLETIRSPFDLFEGDKKFKWLHRVAEHHASSKEHWLDKLVHVRGVRAPVVMLGYRKFEHSNHEGPETELMTMGPGEILKNKRFTIPRKIIGVGNADENWGWLSTYFLNRTVTWAMSFNEHDKPFAKGPKAGDPSPFRYPDEQLKSIVEDPNLVMLVVSQHHNFTHPKIISLPLGIEENNVRDMWQAMLRAARTGLRKEHLIFSAGSDFAFRPAIRSCIAANLGEAFLATSGKVPKSEYRSKLLASAASVAMPGLGYDTYRLWETLASGGMPVVERGMGMDRTLYRLPVLLLDDYASLTIELLRQAYIEALYRVDEWQYERMTKRWWEQLIYAVAEEGTIRPLLDKHPMEATDTNFTRPLVPFDCAKLAGGCGPGTKRVPAASCAIDFSLVHEKYNFRWKHERKKRARRRMLRG